MTLHPQAPIRGIHDAIKELARQTERPIEEVEAVYARQLDLLQSYAKVTAFVPILAKRRAREALIGH